MITLLLLLATLSGASAVPTGEIFGDIQLGEKYLADVPLKLKCGDQTVEAKSDSSGSFRLRVKEDGECKLTVTYDGQSASLNVVVFAKPTRYRFALVEDKDGKYVLKRR